MMRKYFGIRTFAPAAFFICVLYQFKFAQHAVAVTVAVAVAVTVEMENVMWKICNIVNCIETPDVTLRMYAVSI